MIDEDLGVRLDRASILMPAGSVDLSPNPTDRQMMVLDGETATTWHNM